MFKVLLRHIIYRVFVCFVLCFFRIKLIFRPPPVINDHLISLISKVVSNMEGKMMPVEFVHILHVAAGFKGTVGPYMSSQNEAEISDEFRIGSSIVRVTHWIQMYFFLDLFPPKAIEFSLSCYLPIVGGLRRYIPFFRVFGKRECNGSDWNSNWFLQFLNPSHYPLTMLNLI